MTEVTRIVDQLKRAFTGPAWHGPSVMEVLQEGLGDSKYRPCPLLRKMVDAGQLGRKSGQGFYRY